MPARRRARFAVVRARFNEEITKALLAGAVRGFAAAGVPESCVDVVAVPGAFELPTAALWLARTKRYDAIVCLGCVIRGETPHFEYVASQAARGIGDVALATGIPVIFGVLTTDTPAQARARSARAARKTPDHVAAEPKGNKGFEAAQAAVEMAGLRKKRH